MNMNTIPTTTETPSLLAFDLAISSTIMDDDLEGTDKIRPCTYVRWALHERIGTLMSVCTM